jgi:predicted O-methyltransferase YrrM
MCASAGFSTVGASMNSFSEAWRLAKPIEGWLTQAQGRRLYDAAARLGPGDVAVEIGSHHGKSTVIIASALPEGAKVLAIDPFDDERWGGGRDSLAIFNANLERGGISDKVELQRGLSGEVVTRWPSTDRIALLYIDGAHDYPSVSRDITFWGAYLAEQASVLIHDAFSSIGVTGAVLRHLTVNRLYDYRGAAGTLVHFSHERSNPLRKVLLAAHLAYFARNLGVKFALRHRWDWLRVGLRHRTTEYPY